MKNKNDRTQDSNSNNNNKNELFIKEKFKDKYTQNQLEILKTGLSKECKSLWIDGIYGSSKSYLSILIGLKLLNERKIDQILFIRNPVEASTTSKLGALPGLISEKMQPYNQIFFDKLSEFLSKSDVAKLQKENKIDCLPLGFCRGLSWENKLIVVDEAASLTFDDCILLLTRCAEHTKIFFIGDSLNQNDIGSKSGFRKMFELLSDAESKENGIFTFELNKMEDIVRSKFVLFIMKKTGKIKY